MDGLNYLALDIGEKRIGVAVGSTIPFGRGVLPADNPELTLTKLQDIIVQEHISAIIVGLPEVKSGKDTTSYTLAKEWITRLEKTLRIPITTVNEAYSSREAEAQLRQHGVNTQQDKWRVDEQAACLLLEQYLHEHALS